MATEVNLQGDPELKVTEMQPTYTRPTLMAVNDYLPLSIFALFCCLPLGLIATVFSCQAQKAKLAEDKLSAKNRGRLALAFSVSAIVVGLLMGLFIIKRTVEVNKKVNPSP